MESIKTFLFGRSASGENILTKEPKFKTYNPSNFTDFNDWAKSLRVSSRVEMQRTRIANPYIK